MEAGLIKGGGGASAQVLTVHFLKGAHYAIGPTLPPKQTQARDKVYSHCHLTLMRELFPCSKSHSPPRSTVYLLRRLAALKVFFIDPMAVCFPSLLTPSDFLVCVLKS